MNHTTFDVSRFQNASGSTAWRVTGWLHGHRVRKNFKSREEASAEKASLEIKALQATSGLRSIATPLTDEQVREAEAAFQRLADKPRPLTFYLDFAFANYREPESQKLLSDAITDSLKQELRTLLPDVLAEVGLLDELSLNAKIGSKHDDFFDLKTDVISSQEEFVSRWLEGLKKSVERGGDRFGHLWVWHQLKAHKKFRKYVVCFLKRSYLNYFEELSRNRPPVEEAEIWIGQQHANYGLLVTPRYVHGQWENDKSEIRAFPKAYWTIGHVLETGLVIPGSSSRMTFSDFEQYLVFFKETLVRSSGSKYEYQIAGHYCDFVRKHADPESVPLLIPEFRYAGLATKHLYRLDFLVINPFTLDKVGFELSPWSTHGYLSKTKGLTQAQINDMARDNFEREMTKHRDYFKKHHVFCLIFTDEALKDTKALFDDEIRPLLSPEKTQVQLSFQILDEFFHS